MADRRVVITGMGAVTPLGIGIEKFWDRLINSESGVDTIDAFDTSAYDVHFGGWCTDFKVENFIERRESKLPSIASLSLQLVAAIESAADSGIDFAGGSEDPTRIGVVVGSGIGGLLEIEEQYQRLLDKGPSKVSAFTVPKLMANAASGNISIKFGAEGPNTAVTTACASASHAMGDALTAIQYGLADVMFTGGAEAALTPLGLAAFCAMKALSTRNDEPSSASRPFDKDRDGFVMGEGAGILIFEELDRAKARGARIYAEVVSVGATGDAGHITQPAEDGHGAINAMTRALTAAQVDPAQIDYINAHGTSTPLGDIAETVAIKTLFKDHARKLAISSTKSSIGHLLGASGGVELIAVALGMVNNVIPPTINLQNPDPQCDLDYVPNTARDSEIKYALSNSFGFGGHNATVCIKSYK